MIGLEQIPDWFGEAIFGAMGAVLGFFGKIWWEGFSMKRTRKSETVISLRCLQTLLEDSKSVYQSQNYMARRLLKLLREKYPLEAEKGLGFDETFYCLFERMDVDERELQSLIRSTTMNSMKRLNEELQRWININQAFRVLTQPSETRSNFAKELQQLELHLNQWLDKYNANMSREERRSLVYLADEKKHGKGFPKDILKALEAVLEELS